jgi:hypothetical protein
MNQLIEKYFHVDGCLIWPSAALCQLRAVHDFLMERASERDRWRVEVIWLLEGMLEVNHSRNHPELVAWQTSYAHAKNETHAICWDIGLAMPMPMPLGLSVHNFFF